MAVWLVQNRKRMFVLQVAILIVSGVFLWQLADGFIEPMVLSVAALGTDSSADQLNFYGQFGLRFWPFFSDGDIIAFENSLLFGNVHCY